MCVCIGVCVWVGAFALANGALLASTHLHVDLVNNILRAPSVFFDQTPLGRIINRFSKDIDTIDTSIPQTMSMWLRCVLQASSMVVVIGYSTPLFLLAASGLGIVYYLMQVREGNRTVVSLVGCITVDLVLVFHKSVGWMLIMQIIL